MAGSGKASGEPPIWRSVVSGSVGGVCATLVGHPFESVKVRLQTGQTKNLFSNVYAGIMSPLAGVTPLWAFAYFSYRAADRALPDDMSTLTRGSIAGAFSGIASVVIKTPVEAVKVVAQNNHISAGGAIRKLMAEQGLLGLYRGNLATIMHMGPSQAAFFSAYELSREWLLTQDLNMNVVSFCAGGMAGMVEWTLFMPTDVVKTKTQTTLGLRVRDAWGRTYREFGVRGFYKGYLPTILRAFPANGAAFLGIEFANRAMSDLSDSGGSY